MESDSVAVQVKKGGHSHIEDRYRVIESLAIVDLELCDFSFYAIFDGHGGSECAEFAKERLYQHIAANPRFKKRNLIQSMNEGYMNLDKEFISWASSKPNSSGCCALCLIWDRSRNLIVVANTGDSCAILCRNGTPILLSREYKPTTPSEVERIQNKGIGFKDGRLFGALLVTRALGDKDFKTKTVEGILIADPEVSEVQLTSQDDFVLMASDGFWDVINSEEAIAITLRLFQLFRRTSLGKVVNALVEEAAKRGSNDDITVLILLLKPNS